MAHSTAVISAPVHLNALIPVCTVQYNTRMHTIIKAERAQCMSASARNSAECFVSEDMVFPRMATLLLVCGSVLPIG